MQPNCLDLCGLRASFAFVFLMDAIAVLLFAVGGITTMEGFAVSGGFFLAVRAAGVALTTSTPTMTGIPSSGAVQGGIIVSVRISRINPIHNNVCCCSHSSLLLVTMILFSTSAFFSSHVDTFPEYWQHWRTRSAQS